MSKVWNEYLDGHPFYESLDHRGGGEFVLVVHQSEPIPTRFAVLCGEWLYNLRSCLDYTIWATAAFDSGQLPPPGDEHLQYPIYEREDQWKRNLYRIKALEARHRRMLHHMQPFASDLDANFLARLNELARLDRHRQLNVATAYVAILEPVLRIIIKPTPRVTVQWGQRVLKDGRAEVARFLVEPWSDRHDPAQVSVNPRVGIDPEIEQWSSSPFWRRTRFSDRLAYFQTFVAAEVAAYEYDCTGASRKASMLSDSYRAECDARDRTEPMPMMSNPVEWSGAIAPTPSTIDRFEGRDFPMDSRLDER